MSYENTRVRFCAILEQETKNPILSSQSAYDNLCVLLSVVLDQVHAEFDVARGLRIISISNKFYLESKEAGSRPRNYLILGLVDHRLWRNLDFWEQAILESLCEELRTNLYSLAEDPGERDREALRRNLTFYKLCSLQYDMLTLEVPKAEVRKLVGLFAQSYKLLDSQKRDLEEKLYAFGEDP